MISPIRTSLQGLVTYANFWENLSFLSRRLHVQRHLCWAACCLPAVIQYLPEAKTRESTLNPAFLQTVPLHWALLIICRSNTTSAGFGRLSLEMLGLNVNFHSRQTFTQSRQTSVRPLEYLWRRKKMSKTFLKKKPLYINTHIHYLLCVSCHNLMTAAEGTVADRRSVSDMSVCVTQATARPSTPPAHSSPASPPQMSCVILGYRSIVQPRSWRWGRIQAALIRTQTYYCECHCVSFVWAGYLGVLSGRDWSFTHSLQISPDKASLIVLHFDRQKPPLKISEYETVSTDSPYCCLDFICSKVKSMLNRSHQRPAWNKMLVGSSDCSLQTCAPLWRNRTISVTFHKSHSSKYTQFRQQWARCMKVTKTTEFKRFLVSLLWKNSFFLTPNSKRLLGSLQIETWEKKEQTVWVFVWSLKPSATFDSWASVLDSESDSWHQKKVSQTFALLHVHHTEALIVSFLKMYTKTADCWVLRVPHSAPENE